MLIWSKNSIQSSEVAKELTLAMNNTLLVIPYKVENVVPTGEWEYHLANSHWLDVCGDEVKIANGKLLERLVPYFDKLRAPLNPGLGQAPSVTKPDEPLSANQATSSAAEEYFDLYCWLKRGQELKTLDFKALEALQKRLGLSSEIVKGLHDKYHRNALEFCEVLEQAMEDGKIESYEMEALEESRMGCCISKREATVFWKSLMEKRPESSAKLEVEDTGVVPRWFFDAVKKPDSALGSIPNTAADVATQPSPKIDSRKGCPSELLEKCVNGTVEEVSRLLDEGVNVNVTDGEGNSPLLIAIMNGSYPISNFLLERGANPNAPNMFGNTPVLAIIIDKLHHSDADILELGVTAINLVRAGGKVPLKNKYKATAMHLAALCGDVPEIKRLATSGADVNAVTSEETTPLLLSILAGKNLEKAVRALISSGADVNCVFSKKEIDGNTVKLTPLGCLFALYSKCDGSGVSEQVKNAVSVVVNAGGSMDCVVSIGQNYLNAMQVATLSQGSEVPLLVWKKYLESDSPVPATVYANDWEPWPLEYAIVKKNLTGIFTILTKKNVSITDTFTVPGDKSGKTYDALTYAQEIENAEIVEELEEIINRMDLSFDLDDETVDETDDETVDETIDETIDETDEEQQRLWDSAKKIAASTENTYSQDDIPEDKFNSANARYCGGNLESDEVYLLFDNTVMGSAKDGLIVSTTGVHWHNMWSSPVEIEWGDLKKCTVSGSDLKLNDERVCINCAGDNKTAAAQFYQFIKAAKRYHAP